VTAPSGDLADLIHEERAFGLQCLDDVPVVHDLVADVDGRAEALKRALDDLDRPLDTRAETPRLSQHDTQQWSGH
jgi:hypothetical protein